MTQADGPYHVCPSCFRGWPRARAARLCPHDRQWLLTACPACGSDVHAPTQRCCARCGCSFAAVDLRLVTGPGARRRAPP